MDHASKSSDWGSASNSVGSMSGNMTGPVGPAGLVADTDSEEDTRTGGDLAWLSGSVKLEAGGAAMAMLLDVGEPTGASNTKVVGVDQIRSFSRGLRLGVAAAGDWPRLVSANNESEGCDWLPL